MSAKRGDTLADLESRLFGKPPLSVRFDPQAINTDAPPPFPRGLWRAEIGKATGQAPTVSLAIERCLLDYDKRHRTKGELFAAVVAVLQGAEEINGQGDEYVEFMRSVADLANARIAAYLGSKRGVEIVEERPYCMTCGGEHFADVCPKRAKE